jgi:DNA replication protein DnaC
VNPAAGERQVDRGVRRRADKPFNPPFETDIVLYLYRTSGPAVATAACRWVEAKQNVIFSGQTGVGKSYLACALGQKACREGHSVVYRRATRLYDELAQARADGTYFLLLRRLAKTTVLVVDDFGLEVLTASQRRDFLEVLEDRYGTSSTIITSQLDPKNWHSIVGEETIADSVCDRLIHNAHKVRLNGESLRKVKGALTLNQKPAK